MQIIFFAKIDVKKLHLLIGFWNLQKGMTISQKGIIAKKKKSGKNWIFQL